MLRAVAVLASVPLGLAAAVAGTGLVVVDVRELGPGGHRIVVPIPLAAVQAAAAFVPSHAARLDVGPAALHLGTVREVLRALSDAPDGELIRVEEPGEQVVVSKEAGLLRVRVHGKDEDVTVSLPLAMALEALPADGRSLSPAAIAGALASARFTELVDVRSDREHVTVTMY
jgi:hypothetical protein